LTARVDIRPQDLTIVRHILRANLPASAQVFVFGSRATGRTRRSSDLDLAVDLGRPLTRKESATLAEAFDESDLSYRVDVVDLNGVSESFKAIIEQDRTPLLMGQD
jgi:predicted nucleotidyltransferase